MKKGFTLIELLIVMVLVGVLVTIALPKYYSSMERGRVLEAITNLRTASDSINAAYILNENAYPSRTMLEEGGHVRGDFTKSNYFTTPGVYTTCTAQEVHIVSGRSNGDEYMLIARNQGGELKEITCSGPDAAKICENVGFEKSGSTYKMDFMN